MTAGVPFPLPPGRVLSAWRRQLAASRPGRFRLAHLLVHRVEALVRIVAAKELDQFDAALLRQLAAGVGAERLGVDGATLARWADGFEAEGLLGFGAGGPGLTDKGRAALEAGAYPSAAEERRVFTFVNRAGGRPPAFLALPGPAAALPPPPGWGFDPAVLAACVSQPAEWKARHGFPADVEAVVAATGSPAMPHWRRVMLDRPEQVLLVFVWAEDAARPGWRGCLASPGSWALDVSGPAVALDAEEGGPEALPELADEPSPETWQQAWRAWCASRGVSSADAAACRLIVGEAGATVLAPPSVAGRLGGRPDEWLVAGEGRVRVPAPLEVRESQADGGR
jgi:hypothetical protein